MPNESPNRPLIQIRHLGLMEYGACWDLQRQLHADVVAGRMGSCILSVEHPAVFTLGKHAAPQHMLHDATHYQAHGIGLYQIDRGGEVTAHEPGQLVIYPILRLNDFQLAPKSYVQLLESSVIDWLERYGVKAHTDKEHPGVWVGQNKICAVGIRIKERVSMHGIALNLYNSLRLFQLIVPCGIKGRGVTSLARLGGDPQTLAMRAGDDKMHFPTMEVAREELVEVIVHRLQAVCG